MSQTVSVVIATYNRGAQIAKTIDSVLTQSVPPLEIVVIDDGSTDGTGDWIRTYYPSVRTITYQNGGTSLSRNRGAEQALGDVLVFLDHDDLLLEHAIETLLSVLTKFPTARAAFADHELLNPLDGVRFRNHHTEQLAFQRLSRVPVLQRDGTERLYGTELRYALLHGNLLQQPWAVYRHDFLAIGGFDPAIRYCEDWELYMRMTNRHPVALTDRVISIHLVEGGNLHRVAGQDVQHMKVIRKHIALSGLHDWRAVRVLRRRLANYHKTHGDHLRHESAPGAWSAYVRSLVTWPFDPVVAMRCLAWLPEGFRDLIRSTRT